MKRVKAIVGYAIVLVLFVSLLALELAFVAMIVLAIVGVVVLVRQSISPGDVFMNLWRAVMIVLFGAMAGLSAFLTIWFPYGCIKGWMSTVRQSPSPAA